MKNSKLLALLLFMAVAVQSCAPVQTQNLDIPDENPLAETPPLATLPPALAETPSAQITPTLARDENGPLAVAESFYDWYFAQPSGEVLTDRSYASSPYLSEIWKSDLGYLLDSFENQAGYDPFTCAQNRLPSLSFDPVFISAGDAYIVGNVISNGAVQHYFVVQLGQGEGEWKIDAVHCPFDPQTTVMAFYTWYLGTIYQGTDAQSSAIEPRNPIAEGLLEGFYLASPALIDGIETELREMRETGGAYDPILNAQAIPSAFWVEPGQEGSDIQVRLTYGPQSSRYSVVHLVPSERLYWLVDKIEQVEVPVFDPQANQEIGTEDWQEYRDEAYGFSMRIPNHWTTEAADLSAMPADNAVKKGVFFLADWADPDLPVLWLNVLEGTEEQVSQYYPVESHQVIDLGGNAVWVDRDQCETRFVFQHPRQANVWLVIGDTCSSMPGRERYAEELEQIMAPLLRTVTFLPSDPS